MYGRGARDVRRRAGRDADLELSRQLGNNPLVAVETREIVGREEELAALVACLEQRQWLPREIVIEGEAGIGKTTLWRHAIGKAQAFGYRVL
jgi:MoxR-like ATPase